MSKLKWYRLLLRNHSKGISFIEKDHKYYRGLDEYKSVSSIIDKYHRPFDETGEIIKRCAERKCITVEELSEQWDKKRDAASDLGTKVHELAERKMLSIDMLETYNTEFEPYIVAIEKFKKSLSDRTYVISTESIIYSDKYKVAGQVDLLLINEYGKVMLLDWKTNKEIKHTSPYDDTLINGLEHLPDCEYSRYSLQLSLYAKMLKDLGVKIDQLELVHLKKYDYSRQHVKYLEKEVNYILENELKEQKVN